MHPTNLVALGTPRRDLSIDASLRICALKSENQLCVVLRVITYLVPNSPPHVIYIFTGCITVIALAILGCIAWASPLITENHSQGYEEEKKKSQPLIDVHLPSDDVRHALQR